MFELGCDTINTLFAIPQDMRRCKSAHTSTYAEGSNAMRDDDACGACLLMPGADG